jgi:diaminopimelate decarboxylase
MQSVPRLALFPMTVEINGKGHLTVGGCDTVALTEEYGTPLYIFDEVNLRAKCTEFKAFSRYYPDVAVVYASKAYIGKALAVLLNDEGLGLDVVSAGEMSIVRSAGFPMNKVYFHGNNKSAGELKLALEWGVGRIVVDNFYELALLSDIAAKMKRKPGILLRLTPGIDPHTHKYISTGIIDSKFGFDLSSAAEAVAGAMVPNLDLVGLHFHLGSLLFETDPFKEAITPVLKFAAEMKSKFGFELKEFNVGGGFAIQYTVDRPAPEPAVYAQLISAEIKKQCTESNLDLPRLVIEPGRSIVGRSGVALYRAGAIKDIPGVRRYVSVDGGMADNIRPALYESKYEALVANKASAEATDKITIAGKFCESGDILISDIDLPPVSSGDIIAIPDCGAYCLSMGSNYNASLRPPVVMVKEGKARLIRRGETFDDLTRCDIV